ncbi:MAG: class I SAM-dependent methyltransferase [Chitinispirillaceae bacterium]|jgi:SAM-dependent methyltransferase|nr:class I SAM-dependent methyltransferase [Chitinispirillaceae bacterium]
MDTKQNRDFENSYFDGVYRSNYLLRNPKHKIHFYLNKTLKYKRSGSLLDIGCAYGLFCEAASPYFACTGCDISEHAIKTAADRAGKNISYFVSSLPAITTDKTFDVVSCFDVLEHVPELDGALSRLKSLLRDTTSILLITVPVYDGLTGILVDKLDNDPTHIHKKSRIFWKDKLREHGLFIAETAGMFRYFLLNRWYIHFGHALLWPVSPAIFMIARKQ